LPEPGDQKHAGLLWRKAVATVPNGQRGSALPVSRRMGAIYVVFGAINLLNDWLAENSIETILNPPK
jgi:hypothetical protein